jgi:hypothetical protein
MHDPLSVLFDVPNPFVWRRRHDGKLRPATLATVWHRDPERDGTDDSCGRFMRARHGDQQTLKNIISEYDFHWDDESIGSWFRADGTPILSPIGITCQLFSHAYWRHSGRSRRRTDRFMRRRLADIVLFAENTVDSLRHPIVGQYGFPRRDRRIEDMAAVVYGCILRWERPWWKDPLFHVHHWHVQVQVIQQFKRWAFSRCDHCGGRFRWGESPHSTWSGTGPTWFRNGETVWHEACHRAVVKVGMKTHHARENPT